MLIADLPIHMYRDWDTIISGGVEIRGARARSISRRLPASEPVLEEYKFTAHRDGEQVSLQEALRLSAHIALEYHQVIHVKTIEVIDNADKLTTNQLASPILIDILNDLPLIQANVILAAPPNHFDNDALARNVNFVDISKLSKDENALFVVGVGFLTKTKNDQLQQILPMLRNGGFVLTRERSLKPENFSALSEHQLDVILEKNIGKESVILLKKKQTQTRKTEIIHINNNEFSWLKKLNAIMEINNNTDNVRIILLSTGDFESGLLGLVNCLRKEPGGEIIRGILIQDANAPDFSLQNPLYSKQLQLDLPINVLRPGKIWGSYRHHQLKASLKSMFAHHAFVDQTVRKKRVKK